MHNLGLSFTGNACQLQRGKGTCHEYHQKEVIKVHIITRKGTDRPYMLLDTFSAISLLKMHNLNSCFAVAIALAAMGLSRSTQDHHCRVQDIYHGMRALSCPMWDLVP